MRKAYAKAKKDIGDMLNHDPTPAAMKRICEAFKNPQTGHVPTPRELINILEARAAATGESL